MPLILCVVKPMFQCDVVEFQIHSTEAIKCEVWRTGLSLSELFWFYATISAYLGLLSTQFFKGFLSICYQDLAP